MEFPDHGGILPIQAIGMSFQGVVPSGQLNLNYIFQYGSRDTIRSYLDGASGMDDENNGNQVNVSLFIRPDQVPGLQVGGSFYHDEISDDRNLTIRYGQTILNAHVAYVEHGLELIARGYWCGMFRRQVRIFSTCQAFPCKSRNALDICGRSSAINM